MSLAPAHHVQSCSVVAVHLQDVLAHYCCWRSPLQTALCDVNELDPPLASEQDLLAVQVTAQFIMTHRSFRRAQHAAVARFA